MIWKVTTKGGESFTLDEQKLYEQLLMAIVDKQKEHNTLGGKEITKVLLDWLCSTGYLIKYDLMNSFYIAFKLGFYYKSFLEKQKVKIIDTKIEEQK